ncbi:MAG: hypothetical protein LBV49_03475 [Azonexus sp.]|jgi:cytochrome c-type biogenesis protein CcmH/NrfG|nr:hypothetical protein [Azonexus sp.]
MNRKITVLALALLLPLDAALAFKGFGAPDASDPSRTSAAHSGMDMNHAGMKSDPKDNRPIGEKMIERLKERLAKEPDNLPAWVMLANIYKSLDRNSEAAEASATANQRMAAMAERLEKNPEIPDTLTLVDACTMLGRYDDAVKAYARIENQIGDDPDLLVDYAQTLARANHQIMAGKPLELVDRVLKSKPQHLEALLFAAAAALEAKDQDKARAYWETALPLVEPNSELEQDLRNKIKQLEKGKGKGK